MSSSEITVHPFAGVVAPVLVGGTIWGIPKLLRRVHGNPRKFPKTHQILRNTQRQMTKVIDKEKLKAVDDVVVDNAWISFFATHLLVKGKKDGLNTKELGSATVFFLGMTTLVWVARRGLKSVVGNWIGPREGKRNRED